MFLGLLSGAKEKCCLNELGQFKTETFVVGTRFLSECPVSVSAGLEWTSFGLESCMSAEEVYLEIRGSLKKLNPLSVTDDTIPTAEAEYSIVMSVTDKPRVFPSPAVQTPHGKEHVCSGVA